MERVSDELLLLHQQALLAKTKHMIYLLIIKYDIVSIFFNDIRITLFITNISHYKVVVYLDLCSNRL